MQTRYKVEMRTRAHGATGELTQHSGTVDAHSVLAAVGQACLKFKVRTDAIVYLSVEAVAETG